MTETNLDTYISPLNIELASDLMRDGPDRMLLGFSVQHSSELRSLHIQDCRQPENKQHVELWVSDEVRKLVNSSGRYLVRKLLTDDIIQALQDPYGIKSLDPMKHEQEAQEQRTINKVSNELEALMGFPIAIKGTGKNISLKDIRWENLLEQFKFMRQLSLKNQELQAVATGRIGYCPLKFLNVYGALNYPVTRTSTDTSPCQDIQQFLIMERVIDGKQMDQDPKKVAEYVLRFDDPESFDESTGFFAADHPRLAAYVGSNDEFVGWLEIKAQLKKDGVFDVPDLNARNILYRTSDETGKKDYTIIDQIPIIPKVKNQLQPLI